SRAVLLPRAQPGDPHRVRPSPRCRVRQRGPQPSSRAHGGENSQRWRLRRRPARATPRAVRPSNGTSRGAPLNSTSTWCSNVIDMATIPDSRRDLLDAPVATLAIVGADGRPQLSAVWFLADDDGVRLSLNNSRQKTKNLTNNSAATLFILDTANPA